MKDKKAIISLLAGVGLISYGSRRKGSQAKLTTMGAAETWRKESMTYQQKNIIFLAIREAVQNSLDAVRAAIANGSVLPKDAFIAVYYDRLPVDFQKVGSTLTIDDTGIGMDIERALKFITLHGSDKGEDTQASGGWGVAKAVIFTLSSNMKANFRTQDIFVPIEGYAKPGESVDEGFQTGLPFIQGTRLTILDIDKDEVGLETGLTQKMGDKGQYTHLFAGRYIGWDQTLSYLFKQLLGSVGTDIPIYLKFGNPPGEATGALLNKLVKPAEHLEVKRIFDVSKMTRINPESGRKSRIKKADVLYEKDDAFLKSKIYMGLLKDFKVKDILETSGYIPVCVRLNDMFMFYFSISVSSKGIQGKIILYDLYTNIRPYQEDVYPLSKTRENLTGKAKSVIDDLIRQMNQESVSAGADFEARILRPSNLNGLKDFQNKIVKDLFNRAKVPNKAREKITAIDKDIQINLDEDNRAVERDLSGQGNWRTRDFLKKTDVQNSAISSVGASLLPNIAPMLSDLFRNDWRGKEEKSQEGPRDGIDIFMETKVLQNTYELLRLVRRFFGEHTNSDYENHYAYINTILNVIGPWRFSYPGESASLSVIWGLFIRRNRDFLYPSLSARELQYEQQFWLVPPIHLILMDIRDVLLMKMETRLEMGKFVPCMSENALLKRDKIVAQLNLFIAGFSNPSSISYMIESFEAGISTYAGMGDSRSSDPDEDGYFGFDQTRGRLGQFEMHRVLSYDEAYFYGLEEPGFWWPKLKITEKYFPNDGPPIHKNNQRMLKIIQELGQFDSLKDDGRDLIGCPTRIKFHLGLSSLEENPFTLRATYLGSQLITMLQGMYDKMGNRRYPLQFWEEDRDISYNTTHGYTLGFITYFYDVLKNKNISEFTLTYNQYRSGGYPAGKAQAQSASKELAQTNQNIKKLFSLLPKKLKDEQELPLTYTINPFDGFGMVRYGITLSGRTINSIERNFMDYIPLLCCWSSLIGMIDAIAGNRIKVSCGLAFEDPKIKGTNSDYSALAQSIGNSTGLLFLRAEYYEYTPKTLVDSYGTRLFSVAVHEYCHIGKDGHGQEYAYLRDFILDASLPYLPYILELISEQLGLAPPTQSAKITQLQAKLAIRQAELSQSRTTIKGMKK